MGMSDGDVHRLSVLRRLALGRAREVAERRIDPAERYRAPRGGGAFRTSPPPRNSRRWISEIARIANA